jgi:hypothetical protein
MGTQEKSESSHRGCFQSSSKCNKNGRSVVCFCMPNFLSYSFAADTDVFINRNTMQRVQWTKNNIFLICRYYVMYRFSVQRNVVEKIDLISI